jgi:hypothetical protein
LLMKTTYQPHPRFSGLFDNDYTSTSETMATRKRHTNAIMDHCIHLLYY